MADLRRIKPDILFGIWIDSIVDFEQRRGDIGEKVRDVLLALPKQHPTRTKYQVEVGDTGLVEVTSQAWKSAFIAVGAKGLYANQQTATSLGFYATTVATLCPRILAAINRSSTGTAGLSFRKTIHLSRKDNPVACVMENIASLKRDSLGQRPLSPDSLNRIGFEVRFDDDKYTRHLVVKANQAADTSNDGAHNFEIDFDTKLIDGRYHCDEALLENLFQSAEAGYRDVVESFGKELFELL